MSSHNVDKLLNNNQELDLLGDKTKTTLDGCEITTHVTKAEAMVSEKPLSNFKVRSPECVRESPF